MLEDAALYTFPYVSIQEYVKIVVNSLQKTNKLIIQRLHFECFVLITFLQVIFEINLPKDAPYHIFTRIKVFG